MFSMPDKVHAEYVHTPHCRILFSGFDARLKAFSRWMVIENFDKTSLVQMPKKVQIWPKCFKKNSLVQMNEKIGQTA